MAYEKKLSEENKNRARKGFSVGGHVQCHTCFEKDREIERLRVENQRLKQNLKYRETSSRQVTDTTHTPSSQVRFKSNSTEEKRLKRGGARSGHRGYGRKSALDSDRIPEAIVVEGLDNCPECGERLTIKDIKLRSLVEVEEQKAERRLYELKRGRCKGCKRVHQPAIPALPRALYGNRLLSQALVQHFVYGLPIGRILKVLGPEVTEGGLIGAFHRVGDFCGKARDPLIEEYRRSWVRHADETGWRTDGQGGYAWIFTSSSVSLFEFRETRASKVPFEILGREPLRGYLVVDRCPSYNRMPVKIQYCYAHLLREIQKLEKEFPDSKEISWFVSKICPAIAEAMKLRTLKLASNEYLSRSRAIKMKIHHEVTYPYQHPGIRKIQDIFEEKEHRMYHWSEDPRVPAENNLAEREIRPTVLSRKTSFGSQSKRGARTRSAIMSVLFTAKKRLKSKPLETWLYESLNRIAEDPSQNIFKLLPHPHH